MSAADQLLDCARHFACRQKPRMAIHCLYGAASLVASPSLEIQIRLMLGQLLARHSSNIAEAREQLQKALNAAQAVGDCPWHTRCAIVSGLLGVVERETQAGATVALRLLDEMIQLAGQKGEDEWECHFRVLKTLMGFAGVDELEHLEFADANLNVLVKTVDVLGRLHECGSAAVLVQKSSRLLELLTESVAPAMQSLAAVACLAVELSFGGGADILPLLESALAQTVNGAPLPAFFELDTTQVRFVARCLWVVHRFQHETSGLSGADAVLSLTKLLKNTTAPAPLRLYPQLLAIDLLLKQSNLQQAQRRMDELRHAERSCLLDSVMQYQRVLLLSAQGSFSEAAALVSQLLQVHDSASCASHRAVIECLWSTHGCARSRLVSRSASTWYTHLAACDLA